MRKGCPGRESSSWDSDVITGSSINRCITISTNMSTSSNTTTNARKSSAYTLPSRLSGCSVCNIIIDRYIVTCGPMSNTCHTSSSIDSPPIPFHKPVSTST